MIIALVSGLIIVIIILRWGLGIGSSSSPSYGTTPTTPPPPPSSAPATSTPTRNYTWLWWLLAVAALIGIIWVSLRFLPYKLTTTTQTTTIKQPLAKKRFETPLRFVRGEKITHSREGILRIENGGYVNLEVDNLPKKPGIRYWIKLSVRRESDGKHLLVINGQTQKELQHIASNAVENKVFDSRDIGTQDFREGRRNFFRFSSPGDQVEVHSASIEAEWYE